MLVVLVMFLAVVVLPWGWPLVGFSLIYLAYTGISHFGLTARSRIQRLLDKATNLGDWKRVAKKLDDDEGFEEWRFATNNRSYNVAEIARRVRELTLLREKKDMKGFVDMLRSDFHRVSCGITNPPLYDYRTGTTYSIERYVALLVELCQELAKDESISTQEKKTTLHQVIRSYGHSALILNSSVALGAYHLGVVKSLNEAGLLPNIVFGCNTGAITAAFLCATNNVEDVYNTISIDFTAFKKRDSKGSLKRKVNRLLKEGKLMDVDVLSQFAKDNLGDLTFLEAFEKTGRVLNIHVEVEIPTGSKAGSEKQTSSWLLNYLTAPNVLVRTAAVGSCATFGFYGFAHLLAKNLSGDVVPYDLTAFNLGSNNIAAFHVNDAMERMREQFNINCFIVSDATIQHSRLIRLGPRPGILPQVLHFFTEEFWRLLAAVSRIPIFRSRLTGVLQVMNEPVEGDVVISPVSKWTDLSKLVLSNPDSKLLNYCLARGEQATWPKLPQIRTHVAVEQALEQALIDIEGAVGDEQKSVRRSQYEFQRSSSL